MEYIVMNVYHIDLLTAIKFGCPVTISPSETDFFYLNKLVTIFYDEL